MTDQQTALAIQEDQREFSQDQVAVLRNLGVENASREELAVYFHTCARTGLDPFARQIYMIQRQGKQTIQTGIDGFRLVAQRTTERTKGTLGYEDPLWCGEDGVWKDVWLSKEPPVASKSVVIRNGGRFPAVALYDEYVGRKRNGEANAMWSSKPALMLQKCAAALALRSAFPQDLSGLYVKEETDHHNQLPAVEQYGEEPGGAPDGFNHSLHPDGFDPETASYKELMAAWKRAKNGRDEPGAAFIAGIGKRRFPEGDNEKQEGGEPVPEGKSEPEPPPVDAEYTDVPHEEEGK